MNREQREALAIIGGQELVDAVEDLGKKATEDLERRGIAWKSLELPAIPKELGAEDVFPSNLAALLHAVASQAGPELEPELTTLAEQLEGDGPSQQLAGELLALSKRASGELKDWLFRFQDLVGQVASDGAPEAVKGLVAALARVDPLGAALRSVAVHDKGRRQALSQLRKELSQPSTVEALAGLLTGPLPAEQAGQVARVLQERVKELHEDVRERGEQLQALGSIIRQQRQVAAELQRRLDAVEAWARLSPQGRQHLSQAPKGIGGPFVGREPGPVRRTNAAVAGLAKAMMRPDNLGMTAAVKEHREVKHGRKN